jgi:hypothetical protein
MASAKAVPHKTIRPGSSDRHSEKKEITATDMFSKSGAVIIQSA